MENKIINQLSKELNISEQVILKTYKSYWLFIKEQIKSLPLKDNLTEEDFNKLNTSFNIPKIGKFFITYKEYLGIKKKYNIFTKKYAKSKEN